MNTLATSSTIAETQVSARRPVAVEFLVFLSILFGAAGQLVVKAGLINAAIHPGTPVAMKIVQALLNIEVLAGLFLYAVGTIFWLFCVSKKNISYLYPLSAFSYALVALGGHFLFHEVVPSSRWGGIFLVTFGVMLLTLSHKREDA